MKNETAVEIEDHNANETITKNETKTDKINSLWRQSPRETHRPITNETKVKLPRTVRSSYCPLPGRLSASLVVSCWSGNANYYFGAE